MGAASEVEMLQARAQFMRESLGKSRNVTETMISILGSFDNRLSSLETAMRPTQVRVITFYHDDVYSFCASLMLVLVSSSDLHCSTLFFREQLSSLLERCHTLDRISRSRFLTVRMNFISDDSGAAYTRICAYRHHSTYITLV